MYFNVIVTIRCDRETTTLVCIYVRRKPLPVLLVLFGTFIYKIFNFLKFKYTTIHFHQL